MKIICGVCSEFKYIVMIATKRWNDRIDGNTQRMYS